MHTSAEIDLIAAAVERRLQPRFDSLDRRLGTVEELIEALDQGHRNRFDSIERGMVDLKETVARVESNLSRVMGDIVGLTCEVADHDARFDAIERKLDEMLSRRA